MIPKKIHYCWFGDKPLPRKAKKCIKSWKKYFPDYEIIEWNEKNFDIYFNKYASEAYEHKKYAFLTDVARLYIIYNYGGIYFDTDVEVIKNYKDILQNQAFFGLEKSGTVNTGLGFGATKNNEFIKELLDDYNEKRFVLEDNTLDLTTCPVINSEIFKKNKFNLENKYENINGIAVYPTDFFNPFEHATGRVIINDNTHSIHWYSKSWLPLCKKFRSIITRPFHRIFGINCFKWLKKEEKNARK